MDGPGWPASRKKSPLGRSPLLFCLSHLGPGAHDISGDNDGRPRPPPVDASKLSKTQCFRPLFLCTKEFASKWKAPAGLGSKHGLFYGCSKGSKTHDFRALFPCTYEVALKWMGQDGPLQEKNHPWGGHPFFFGGVHDGHLGPVPPPDIKPRGGLGLARGGLGLARGGLTLARGGLGAGTRGIDAGTTEI